MSFTTGTRLGPYEILAPLGAGGIGEVHKARDTRLDRTVAIKVLPAHGATTLSSASASNARPAAGQRFLMNAPLEQTAGPWPLTVVLNWAAGLRR